jgi:hypothetical protein
MSVDVDSMKLKVTGLHLDWGRFFWHGINSACPWFAALGLRLWFQILKILGNEVVDFKTSAQIVSIDNFKNTMGAVQSQGL